MRATLCQYDILTYNSYQNIKNASKITRYDIMSDALQKKNKGGRPQNRQMTYQNIDYAIKSTRSMSQAAVYLGVSYNTFVKYAKQYKLFKPLPSSKGIRRSVNSKFTRNIADILEGKSPNPYREATLLSKAIREGYMKPACNSCGTDFTDLKLQKDPPLVLDFLDKDPMNTRQHNLRALCFNCVYTLYYTTKGWYRHRDTAIRQAYEEANPEVPKISTIATENPIPPRDIPEPTPPENPIAEPEDTDVEFIPFEEFQKTLGNQ